MMETATAKTSLVSKIGSPEVHVVIVGGEEIGTIHRYCRGCGWGSTIGIGLKGHDLPGNAATKTAAIAKVLNAANQPS